MPFPCSAFKRPEVMMTVLSAFRCFQILLTRSGSNFADSVRKMVPRSSGKYGYKSIGTPIIPT